MDDKEINVTDQAIEEDDEVVLPPDPESTREAAEGDRSGEEESGGSPSTSRHEPQLQKPQEEPYDGKIFIGGISWQTSEEGLRYYFERFGELEDVVLMKDKITGQPRGFAFVRFADPAVATKIVKDGHKLDGRTLDVKPAVPRDQAPGPQRAPHQQHPSGTGDAPGQDNTHKIFVGGLDQSVTDAEFRTHFESFGTVTDSIVMIDKRTNRSRGFGFVTFGDAAAFEQVLKSAHIIKGKTVEVKAASPRERSAAAGNWHGGGGGYGGGYPQSSQSYSSSYGNGWGGGRGGYGGYDGYLGGYGGYGAWSPGGYGGYDMYGGNYDGNYSGPSGSAGEGPRGGQSQGWGHDAWAQGWGQGGWGSWGAWDGDRGQSSQGQGQNSGSGGGAGRSGLVGSGGRGGQGAGSRSGGRQAGQSHRGGYSNKSHQHRSDRSYRPY